VTQFNPGTSAPRRGGELTVYTALLAVAAVTLLLGIIVLVQANTAQAGGPFDLVS
jgi:hypothetical protein